MAATVNYWPPRASSSGGGTDKRLGDIAAFIQGLDSTLVACPFSTSGWVLGLELELGGATGSGAVNQKTNLSNGQLQVQSGATANSFRVVRAKGGVATPATTFVPNVRTTHFAVYTRVRVEATTATCTLQCCELADEATFDCVLGVLGATSTTNFVLKVGAAAAIDTGKAFGSSFHDLVLWNDGTNINAYVDPLTSSAAVAQVAASNAGAVGGHWFANAQNGATAANAEFTLDTAAVFTPIES